ncbi:MAG: hypothetical protein ACXWTL_06405 [Methylobacter sp.]
MPTSNTVNFAEILKILLFILIAGCDGDVKPIKTVEAAAAKARLKATTADQIVQDAALKQQRKIEEITR